MKQTAFLHCSYDQISDTVKNVRLLLVTILKKKLEKTPNIYILNVFSIIRFLLIYRC